MALMTKKPMSRIAMSKMAEEKGEKHPKSKKGRMAEERGEMYASGGSVQMKQTYPVGSALPQVNTPKSSVRGNGAAIKAKPPAGLF
jgi:hypothetical protein